MFITWIQKLNLSTRKLQQILVAVAGFKLVIVAINLLVLHFRQQKQERSTNCDNMTDQFLYIHHPVVSTHPCDSKSYAICKSAPRVIGE